MQDAVKLLMDQAAKLDEAAKAAYQNAIKEAGYALHASQAESAAFIKAARAICIHDGDVITKVDDSDYHNNVSWTEQYCKACGAFLRRY